MYLRIRYCSSAHLALVLVMIFGIMLLIDVSTASKLSFAQQPTNTSIMVKKSVPSIQVPTAIKNATMAKVGNLSIIHLSTKPIIPVNIFSSIGGPVYVTFSGFSKIFHECPNEAVILVHGRSNTEDSVTSALEEFDRAAISIENNHYYYPIIGFLWQTGENPFANVTTNTPQAGTVLANFLNDFKYHCERTAVHIVAHSMGTYVITNAIDKVRYKIDSIHFLGSASPVKTPDILSPFGRSVQNLVGHLYNLYSPHDDILSSIGSFLGNTGTSREITTPTNYKDTNVAKEILDPMSTRENHLGYWGFRDKSMHVIDDGAMDIVVSDWLKDTPLYALGTAGGVIELPEIETKNSSISNESIIHG